jgi:ubiquinone/menaquinone biosynthesis C-methylase UbiE
MIIQRRSAIEEQFDKDSQLYLSKHLTPEKVREKDRILDLVKSRKKFKRVLDIGCGPGIITEDLLQVSEEVWGIDISEDMIKVARDRFDSAKVKSKVFFEVGDAETLKFPDQHFDAVFCLGVLRYLSSWETALNEIHRVLKPEGVVVSTFYYQFSPHWFSMFFVYRPLLPLISLVRKRSLIDLVKKYKAEPLPFSYRKFKRIFAQTGFNQTEIQHSGFDIFPINRLFPKLSRYIYLKTETYLYNSNKLGWLGSICIVKGIK